jgi:hypothetical protein
VFRLLSKNLTKKIKHFILPLWIGKTRLAHFFDENLASNYVIVDNFDDDTDIKFFKIECYELS